jgi:acetyl esterase/lipase
MTLREYTQDELSTMSKPCQALTDHMKDFPPPKHASVEDNLPINDIRKNRITHLETRRADYPISGPIPDLVTETDIYIPYPAANTNIQVRVYASTSLTSNASQGVPVIVLMHEGGWMLGDISDEEHNARLFASSFSCVVLNVEYLLAPENPFPASPKSSYHVLQTLCASPGTFHPAADPFLGLILGGSSAGGNLAAVLAQYSRQQKLNPPVTGQWLSVPFITTEETLPEKYKAMMQSIGNRLDPILDPGENGATLTELGQALQIKDFDDPLVSIP